MKPLTDAWTAWIVFAAAGLLFSGCSEILVDDQTVHLDGTGEVRGFVYLDRNGNEESDQDDQALSNLTVRVVQAVGGREVASAVTRVDGDFSVTDVPVGTFRLAVDPTALVDAYEIYVEQDPFVVAADSVTTVAVRASFPTYTVEEVLALEPGVRLFTTGIALNPRHSEGEGAVHLLDGTGYLRATGVEDVPITVGDSVRFRGRTSVEAGLPVLDDVEVFLIQEDVRAPVALDIGTGAAAEAGPEGDGGSLNAALIRIQGAEILGTATIGGHLLVTVDDGSGPVDLVLRNFLAFDPDAFSPGFARIEKAAGLLVANREESGVWWRIVPRFPGDVEVEEFPSLTLQQIRQTSEGQGATGHGIVLNPVDQPVPGTIHIREQGIHLRIRGLTGLGVAPLPGDSIRVRGHTNREALIFPVLDATRVSILSSGGADPQPALRTTAEAATASNGQLADGLVRVDVVNVTATETVDGVFVATVNDGTGPVDIVIHDAIGFDTGGVTPGSTLDFVTGVLEPLRNQLDGSVSWRILPRSSSDIGT